MISNTDQSSIATFSLALKSLRLCETRLSMGHGVLAERRRQTPCWELQVANGARFSTGQLVYALHKVRD